MPSVVWIQATVYLLEKLAVILSKASEEDIMADVLPMIFATLESNSIQGQVRHYQAELMGLSYITLQRVKVVCAHGS